MIPQTTVAFLGFVRDPPAAVECPYMAKHDHTFYHGRAVLACPGLGGGLCAFGSGNVEFTNFGVYQIVCVKGPAGAAHIRNWTTNTDDTPLGSCQLFRFGSSPPTWDLWYAYCTGLGLAGAVTCAVTE